MIHCKTKCFISTPNDISYMLFKWQSLILYKYIEEVRLELRIREI